MHRLPPPLKGKIKITFSGCFLLVFGSCVIQFKPKPDGVHTDLMGVVYEIQWVPENKALFISEKKNNILLSIDSVYFINGTFFSNQYSFDPKTNSYISIQHQIFDSTGRLQEVILSTNYRFIYSYYADGKVKDVVELNDSTKVGIQQFIYFPDSMIVNYRNDLLGLYYKCVYVSDFSLYSTYAEQKDVIFYYISCNNNKLNIYSQLNGKEEALFVSLTKNDIGLWTSVLIESGQGEKKDSIQSNRMFIINEHTLNYLFRADIQWRNLLQSKYHFINSLIDDMAVKNSGYCEF